MAIDREAIRQNEYITTMVKDAIVVRNHPDQIRTISRVTYSYSIVLGRSGSQLVEGMTPGNLSREDIVKLLEFFERL